MRPSVLGLEVTRRYRVLGRCRSRGLNQNLHGFGGIPPPDYPGRFTSSWLVVASHETPERARCVDVFSRPDGSWGFEEFRKDPADMGAWTPVSYFSGREYPTETAAVVAAKQAIPWLRAVLEH